MTSAWIKCKYRILWAIRRTTSNIKQIKDIISIPSNSSSLTLLSEPTGVKKPGRNPNRPTSYLCIAHPNLPKLRADTTLLWHIWYTRRKILFSKTFSFFNDELRRLVRTVTIVNMWLKGKKICCAMVCAHQWQHPESITPPDKRIEQSPLTRLSSSEEFFTCGATAYRIYPRSGTPFHLLPSVVTDWPGLYLEKMQMSGKENKKINMGHVQWTSKIFRLT